jgi:hypothetical protein
MTTDYRALCAELVRTSELRSPTEFFELRHRARVALAQPEPVAPTDEELLESAAKALGYKSIPSDETCPIVEAGELLAFARAVLARWGTPANQPVPVSERLPGPEDCDAEGGCWWWHPDHKEDDFDDGWILLNPKWADGRHDSDDSPIYTHWLPHWALPVPAPANNTINQNNY